MGTVPYSALSAEIRAGLGNRTDLSDARIVTGLNIAQARISRFWDFQELKLTATAQNQFSANPASDKYMRVPANLKTIHTLVMLDGATSRKLTEKPWRMFDQLFPMPEWDPRFKPSLYSRWGYLLLLYPVPDAQYTFSLKFTARPTPFAGESAPNQLSDYEEKDDVLINLTLEYFWRSFGRYDKAEFFLKQAMNDLEGAIKRDDDRPDMSVSWDNLGTIVEGDYWNNPFVKDVVLRG